MALATAATMGCGGPEATDDATSHDAEAADVGSVDDAGACSIAWVARVRGHVIDDRGAAVARARPQLCARLEDERLVCLEPPFTDERGEFLIEVPSEARCMRSAVMRVLLSGGPYATTYCPVPIEGAGDGSLELADPLALFEVQRGVLPPYGDPTMDREVPLGAAVIVDLSPRDVGDEADYARLGAVRVEPSRSCVPAARALAGLLVAAPEASVEAPFRIPASDLTPGTRVRLHVIGGLDTRLADGTIVDEGELAALGGGVVEADGTITPEPTLLLPQLGWLGWSIAP